MWKLFTIVVVLAVYQNLESFAERPEMPKLFYETDDRYYGSGGGYTILEDGRLYNFNFREEGRLTWSDAEYYCRQSGMQLVAMNEKIKEKLIANYIDTNHELDRTWWTAGIRQYNDRPWLWYGPMTMMQYANWKKGYPTDFNAWSCAMFTNGTDPITDPYGIFDGSCSALLSYICEPVG